MALFFCRGYLMSFMMRGVYGPQDSQALALTRDGIMKPCFVCRLDSQWVLIHLFLGSTEIDWTGLLHRNRQPRPGRATATPGECCSGDSDSMANFDDWLAYASTVLLVQKNRNWTLLAYVCPLHETNPGLSEVTVSSSPKIDSTC